MTTNEMRTDVKKLLKRVDEDAKGTRCLTMAEVTLCLDELRRLATPSIASPQEKLLTDLADKWANEGNAEAQPIGLSDRRLGRAEALVSCARQLREAIQAAAT
jgi:hypothetical protein